MISSLLDEPLERQAIFKKFYSEIFCSKFYPLYVSLNDSVLQC